MYNGWKCIKVLKCVCVCCLGVVHTPVQFTCRTLPPFPIHWSSHQLEIGYKLYSNNLPHLQAELSVAKRPFSARCGGWWPSTPRYRVRQGVVLLCGWFSRLVEMPHLSTSGTRILCPLCFYHCSWRWHYSGSFLTMGDFRQSSHPYSSSVRRFSPMDWKNP